MNSCSIDLHCGPGGQCIGGQCRCEVGFAYDSTQAQCERDWFDSTPYIILGGVLLGVVVATLVRYNIVRRRKRARSNEEEDAKQCSDMGKLEGILSFKSHLSGAVPLDDVTVAEYIPSESCNQADVRNGVVTVSNNIDRTFILQHDYLEQVTGPSFTASKGSPKI